MAIAETAELAVLLKLHDQLSGPLATTNARIKELEAGATSASTRGIGNLEKSMNSLGGALGHAKSRMGEILTGPLGFLGLAAGVLTFSGAIEHSIGKAGEWGLQIEKLQGITHNTAEQLSGLLAVTEKYGLANERLSQIAGFTEKTLGNLTTSGKAPAFFKQYGFNVQDAAGKTKDFATVLLTFSDYWNKNTDAGQKAAAAAKIFGRGYADLVPILNLGAQGIKDAEEEAKNLGLTLTQDNVDALRKAREATRQWGDALGGLELQIGLTLLPTITDLAKAATSFVSENRAGIVGFFRDSAKFAQALGGVIKDEVLPIFGAIKSAWMSIPAPLRNLILTGFVADKTIKFLFGFDPAKMLFDVGKSFLGRGGNPAMPLFVADVTNLGGMGPKIPGGGGGVGLLEGLLTGGSLTAGATIAAIVTAAVASTYAFINTYHGPKAMGAFTPTIGGGAFGQGTGNAFSGIDWTSIAHNMGQAYTNPLVDFRAGERVTGELTSATKDLAASMRHPAWLTKLEDIWNKHGEVTRAQLALARKDLESGTNVTKAAGFLGQAHGAGSGGPSFLRATIADLRGALQKTYDPGEINAITHAIHQLQGRLPRIEDNHALMVHAEKIATSTESTANKIRDLKAELAKVESPGLRKKIEEMITKIPDHIGKDVKDSKTKLAQKSDDSKAAITAKQAATTSAVKTMQAVLNAAIRASGVTVITNVAVTAGAVQKSTTTQTRYGPANGSAGGGRNRYAQNNS